MECWRHDGYPAVVFTFKLLIVADSLIHPPSIQSLHLGQPLPRFRRTLRSFIAKQIKQHPVRTIQIIRLLYSRADDLAAAQIAEISHIGVSEQGRRPVCGGSEIPQMIEVGFERWRGM